MRRLMMLMVVAGSVGCATKDSSSGHAGSGSAPAQAHAQPETVPAGSGSAAAYGSAAHTDPVAPPAGDDGAADVAAMVVHDVGSKALGSQKIEASCVSVAVLPAGKWSVAAAHLTGCGDKTARSIVWLYKRMGAGKWNEDYVGQPPKCWKGVPPDLATAVAKATNIPTC